MPSEQRELRRLGRRRRLGFRLGYPERHPRARGADAVFLGQFVDLTGDPALYHLGAYAPSAYRRS